MGIQPRCLLMPDAGTREMGKAGCHGLDSGDIWLLGPHFKVRPGRTRVVHGANEALQFWALLPSFIWRPAPALGKFLAW